MRLRLDLRGAVARVGRQFIGPFNLAIEAGERVAIVGPSGAGKSTLLNLMASQGRLDSGNVHLDGLPLDRWTAPALARRRAVLPQSHAVAFGLPVELVVSLGRVGREPDTQQPRIVRDALALAKAAHLIDRRFDTLSGGEQARVQLARVFAQLWDENEGLLLVDEPLAALDPGLQFELMDALQTFARERAHALVMVLHDLTQALAEFDRLWLLKGGRQVADLRCGPHAVPALAQLYGIGLRWIAESDGGPAVVTHRHTALCP